MDKITYINEGKTIPFYFKKIISEEGEYILINTGDGKALEIIHLPEPWQTFSNYNPT
jgi:hypothetical protein